MLYASQLPQNAPAPGEVLGGKYRVDGLLGRGGMGTVFLAENLLTGRQIAIKWCHAAGDGEARARARFLREARAAARIRNPHVVDVYDVAEHAGVPFLVMEYLRGESLQQLLERHHRLPPSLVVTWMLAVLEGVAAAHAQGIIHRDLKPDNIFLCERGDGSVQPKVLDFGAAKSLTSDTEPQQSHALTRPGALIGSPSYMAVEQIDGAAVDRRTDVYALGVILYRALGGELPFQGASLSALFAAIAHGTAKPLRELCPDLPPGLETVTARAMARDPEARFPSVEALQAALRALSRGDTCAAPQSSQPTREATRARATSGRRSWIALGALCAAPVAAWLMFARAEEVVRPARTAAKQPAQILQKTSHGAATQRAWSLVPDPGELPPSAPDIPHHRESTQPANRVDAASERAAESDEPARSAKEGASPAQALPKRGRRRTSHAQKKTPVDTGYEPALL